MDFKSWKSTRASFNYRGHNICYWDEGRKGQETLLLVHGFPTASWDWHKLWPELLKHYRLFAIDMIGFGFSDKPYSYPYSIIDQADLHEAILEHKDINNVHILAHDYGDTVVQELMSRLRDRETSGRQGLEIQSVCFLNGGLFPETHQPRFIQKLLISPLGMLLRPFLTKSKLRKNLKDVFGKETPPSNKEIDQFYDLIMYNKGTAIMHKLIRYMSERKQHRERWVDALIHSAAPIRLINGSADPVSGKHMTVRYEELIPESDVVHLPGIGHYPQVEAAEEVLHHFLEFVHSIGRKKEH